MSIRRFRRRPDTADRERLQVAAKYVPGDSGSLDDCLTVARMADHRAEVAEVTFPSAAVLLIRYLNVPDEHPARIEFETVEDGHYLVYSQGNDYLYVTRESEWRQFYDEVTEP